MSEIAEHIFSITENKCLKDVPGQDEQQQLSQLTDSPSKCMCVLVCVCVSVLDQKKSLLTDELQ